MVWTGLVFVCLALCSLTAGSRVKRLTPCINTWALSTNPCQGAKAQVLLAHPQDNTKFLQCDGLGRMFIIQCPTGEVYTQATTSCGAKVSTIPILRSGPFAQCTVINMRANRVYFPVVNNKRQFVECTGVGAGTILTCPALLIWQQSLMSCVYQTGAGSAGISSSPSTVTAVPNGQNPCCSSQAFNGKLYYPHQDPHKFIQCDTSCDAFIVTCPGGLIWDNNRETCFSQTPHIG